MKDQFLIASGVLFFFLALLGLRVFNESLPGTIVSPQFFLSQVAPGPNEALYFFSPSSGTFNVNDTFQVELRIGASSAVTSIKAYLNFNSSLLAVNSISIAGSAFSTFWEQTSTSSQVRLQASQPLPGFTGNSGLVATITFRALAAGTATLTYDASSLALKSDDTNILNLSAGKSTTGSYMLLVSNTTPPPPPPSSGGEGGGGSSLSPAPPSAGPVKGDCNNDNKVNVFDLSIMLSNWKKTTSTCDLNGDGTVNIFDFSILLSNWTE